MARKKMNYEDFCMEHTNEVCGDEELLKEMYATKFLQSIAYLQKMISSMSAEELKKFVKEFENLTE
jgi:hypothetical protein